MPFEALILNQLQRRPADRQTEWLRSLLVQGFLCECRDLQTSDGAGGAGQATPGPRPARPALAVVNDTPMSEVQMNPSAELPDAADTPDSAPLAFAALRKVIG